MNQQYEILSPEFEALIKPGAELRVLGEGYVWSEGAVWVSAEVAGADEGCLLWSDIPNDRMLRWSESEGAVVHKQPCGYTNGHTLDMQGRLVSCQHGERRVIRTEPDGAITVLADNWEGMRLNSPNDVVVKSDGTVWFTDPPYGILSDREGHKSDSELGTNYVFRVWPGEDRIEIVIHGLCRPNGLAFSPDESILYVSDTAMTRTDPRGVISAFDCDPDGNLSNQRVFAAPDAGKSDGFRLDTTGNIWTSAGDGIQVINPSGEIIGKILTGDRTANCDFGGPDRTTLFIAANDRVVSIETNATGARRP